MQCSNAHTQDDLKFLRHLSPPFPWLVTHVLTLSPDTRRAARKKYGAEGWQKSLYSV
jgi:hypothetical protein